MVGREFWGWATVGAGGLFVGQVLLLVAVAQGVSSEVTAVSPVAFLVVAVVSGVVAVGLRVGARGVGWRGLALAAAGTAGLWVLSAVVVFGVAMVAGGA